MVDEVATICFSGEASSLTNDTALNEKSFDELWKIVSSLIDNTEKQTQKILGRDRSKIR